MDFALVQTAAPITRIQLLSQFADVLLTALVCNMLVHRAFQNTPSFILEELANKKDQGPVPVTSSSKKRKRLAEKADASPRMAEIQNPSYPFLVRIQVKLANDNRKDAISVASDMEKCSALKDEDKMAAWSYILDHFRHKGDLFLDGNHVGSNAYLTKRTALYDLRRYMGKLGFDTMIDWYMQLSDEVNKDPLTTLAEKHYVKLASQHTILKLLLDKFGEAGGVKRMLEEYPDLYIWREGGDTHQWAWNFLSTSNPVPESLLLENCQVDMQSLWKRAPPQQPVVAIEEKEQVEVVIAPEVVVDEQAIVEPPSPPHEEARPVKPVFEEIVLSSDDDEQQVEEEENASPEEQDAEEIFESDDDVERHAYNSHEEESADEFDDYRLEQQQDGVEPDADVPGQRVQVVDLLDSSSEEESPSSEEESEESEGTQEFEQPATRPARKDHEETPDEEEVDASYDSQEDGIPHGNDVEVESSPEEEDDGSKGEDEFAEGFAAATQFAIDGKPKEGTDSVAERGQIDKGYEPDTTGQTEEEEDDDKKLSASPRKSFPHARSLIASRPTLSDMDAADERTEPSDVEDEGQQERRSLANQVASSLIEHVRAAPRHSPSSYQAHQDDDSQFHRPATRTSFQAERREEDDLPIVDEVPKIDDFNAGDDATNGTVGPSVAYSDSRAEEIAPVEQLEEGAENVVDHVPPVDDALDGDDTSAAFAASETGNYLSEANTEQPETIMEARVVEEPPSKPAAKEIPERRKGTGNETDVGYMGDIEDRPSNSTNAAATTAAFSMQAPGYEADVEERSVLRAEESLPKKSLPTARALPTGSEMGDSPGEDDSIVVHPTDESVSGHSVTGMSNIMSTSSEVHDTEVALKADAYTEENEPVDEEAMSPKQEEKPEAQSSNAKLSTAVKGASKETDKGDTKQEEHEGKQQKSDLYGSPASHTRSHDPQAEDDVQSPRPSNRRSDLYGSPASRTRSHDPPVKTDERSLSESAESAHEESDSTESADGESKSVSAPNKRGPGRPRKNPHSKPSPAVSHSGPVLSPNKRGPGRPRKSPHSKPSPAATRSGSISSSNKRSPGRPRKHPPTEPSPAVSHSGSVSTPNKKGPGRPRKSPHSKPSPATTGSGSVSSPKKKGPGRPRKNPTLGTGLASPHPVASGTPAVGSQVEVPMTPPRSNRNSVGLTDSPARHLRSHDTLATTEVTSSQKNRRGLRDNDLSAEKVTAAQSKGTAADAELPSTPDRSLDSAPKKPRGRPPKKVKAEEDDRPTLSSGTRRSTRSRKEQSSPDAESGTKKQGGEPKKADYDDGTTESPLKKKRGRPKKNTDEEVAESPPKKRRGRPKKAVDDDGMTESPPNKSRGGAKKKAEEEEAAKSPPKKRRGRPKKADDEDVMTESPPKQPKGSPKKSTDQEEAAKSSPKKRRGRPPKVQKEKAIMEEEESATTVTRRSSRLKAKTSELSQPARRTKTDPDENESDDDEINSQASTRKSRQPARKGKKKAISERDSIGSIPKQVAETEDDGGSVSSMGSSSVASKRTTRRSARATASRDSLSTIAESPTRETTITRSRVSAAKKSSPAKRKSRSAKSSASSVASTSSRATRSTRSSYNLRSKK